MINDLINTSGSFLDKHSFIIALAWTASLLVVFGGTLARFTKNIAQSWHFIFRVLFFIVVCGFGYGYLTYLLANFLNKELSALDNLWTIIAVTVAFFSLGILAERKKQI